MLARGDTLEQRLYSGTDDERDIKYAGLVPERSVYTLQLPGDTQTFPGFHASQLCHYRDNDDLLYPSRALERPPAVQGEGEEQEWELESIIDRRRRGRGWQYRVQFRGWGAEDEQWRSRRELLTLAPEMLAEFEASLS